MADQIGVVGRDSGGPGEEYVFVRQAPLEFGHILARVNQGACARHQGRGIGPRPDGGLFEVVSAFSEGAIQLATQSLEPVHLDIKHQFGDRAKGIVGCFDLGHQFHRVRVLAVAVSDS